jgi:glycosyltransferase involved in cell wall biosynthesis
LKRILIISSEFKPNTGGIGNHAYNLAKYLTIEGYRVHVLTDIIGIPVEQLKQFQLQQSFRITWVRRSKVVVKSYLRRLGNAITLSKNADKIICTGKFPLWTALLLSTFNNKTKFIAVVHGSELDLRSTIPAKLTIKALNIFPHIIAVSEYTKDFMPASAKGSITVIHNGIDPSDFISYTKQSFSTTPNLITVGSITERKGQMNVIKALPGLVKHFPNIHYRMIGKPVITDELKKLAQELYVQQHVSFLGMLPNNDMKSILASSDIKVMLSNHTNEGDFEGFGIGILEANVVGVPAIGSAKSGIADAIKDKATGILVDQDNTDEIVGAVEEILNNYSQYSSAAKHWALQHDWKNIIQQYKAVIEN